MTTGIEEFLLYRSYIFSAEDFVELKVPEFNITKTREYCYRNKPHFFPYHKNAKFDQRRTALPILNLDGEPNDDSFFAVGKSGYSEMSFSQRTLHYTAAGLDKLLDRFGKNLGRTHIINAKMGGFFKVHRDGPNFNFPTEETVRLLLCIDHCQPYEMHFILENSKVLPLQTGKFYYINTFKQHSQISFHDDCFFLIASVRICKDTIKILDHLSARP